MSEPNIPQAALYKALAAAQGEFRAIVKNREVSIRPREGLPYKFRYADMEELISATRPALSKHGLAVIQSVGRSADGMDYMETGVLHADGGAIWSRLPMIPFKGTDDPKKFGAAMTYLRRYQYGALLCLSADDDLDEDGVEVGAPQTEARKPPAERAPAKAKRQAEPEPLAETETQTKDAPRKAGVGEVSWVKKKLEALGLAPDFVKDYGAASADEMTMEQFGLIKAELMKR